MKRAELVVQKWDQKVNSKVKFSAKASDFETVLTIA